jgi:hypothetical protein
MRSYTGTRSLVTKWIRAHGRARDAPTSGAPLPAARQLVWLVLKDEEQRTPDENTLWARLQQHDERQQVAALVRQGTTRIRQRQALTLTPGSRPVMPARMWSCATTPMAPAGLCSRISRDDPAVVQWAGRCTGS